jgi:GNAT superfamily N-acetyltransferase
MHEANPYHIRVARDDELAKLGEVERRAGQLFATTAHAYLCDAPTLSLEILRAQHRCGAVWVATDKHDRPVGFAVAGELGGEAYLYEIDVDASHGRRGVGRLLMEAVFDWVRARDYPTLTLSTFVDVAWNAPYYAKLGFEVVSEDELTPAMVETRVHEAEAGFLVERRVFMRRSMRQPS